MAEGCAQNGDARGVACALGAQKSAHRADGTTLHPDSAHIMRIAENYRLEPVVFTVVFSAGPTIMSLRIK